MWTNLGKHSLFVWLSVACIKTVTRHIIRLDGLSSVVRRSRRTMQDCSSRRIMLFSTHFKIYVSYIHIHLFILHGYITNSQYDHLQVGFIAVGGALHRHRSGYGFESRSILNVFRLSFRNCLSCVLTARIILLFNLSSAVQNICFIYSYPLFLGLPYSYITSRRLFLSLIT